MEWVTQFYKKLWTMLVELGLIVTLSIPMGLVTTPTLSKLTAVMLSTAISRERVKLKALVIFPEVQPLPLPIPVASLSSHSLLLTIFPILPNGNKVKSTKIHSFFTRWFAGTAGCPYPSSARYVWSPFLFSLYGYLFLIFPFGKFSLLTRHINISSIQTS